MQHVASFGVALKRDKKPKHENRPEETEDAHSELLPVHRAAADGDIGHLVKIIQEDPSLLEQYSVDGVTPLGQAVLNQKLDVVKRLIQMGANINAQDSVGRTCLSIAAYQGWHNGVVCLLRNGAKQSICDKSGRYPLHAATYHSDISTMTILLNGLTKREINFPDHEMMTAVHWAAFHDRPEHLMQLLQKGGDVLARDVDGKLPLHWAAQNASFQCTHRLISLTEGLAMVNDVDSSGKSPAHYAAAAGSANILRIIERCETADLEMEDPDERTPLHWAAAMGHANAVEALLKLGVNPHPHDVDGFTPLDYAVQTGSRECAKVIEAHVGHRRSSSIKDNKKYRLSLEDMRQRKEQLASSESSKAHVEGVPIINVQPPTTTLSKATTNPDCMYPRMYSASTDTDAPVHQPQVGDSQPQSPTTARKVHYTHKELPTTRWAREDAQGGILSKLIESSFMAVAFAPVLKGSLEEEEEGEKVDEDVEHQKPRKRNTREPKEQTIPHRDQMNTSIDVENENGDTWAHPTDQETPDAGPDTDTDKTELQIQTSGNTPDIQRVSVQSFRSVPPIRSGREREEAAGTSRDHVGKTTGLRLQAARLTPLPGITPRSSPPQENDQTGLPDDSGAISTTEPLSHRGPLRVLDEDTNTAQTNWPYIPPIDFMTENNAETRILTKKYKNTLAKFYDMSVKQQTSAVPASHPQAPSTYNNTTSTSTAHPLPTTSTNNNTTLAATNKLAAGDHSRKTFNHKDSHLRFFKHSRIPSTRIGAQNTESITQGAASSKPQRLQPPVMQNPSQTNLSSAGMFRTQHEKYIREDEDNAPASPTPLAGHPATMLAASMGGRRKAQETLVGNSGGKANRKKPVRESSESLWLQQQQQQQHHHHQHYHQPLQFNPQQKQHYYHQAGSRDDGQHHHHHINESSLGGRQNHGRGGVGKGANKTGVHLPALRPANLLRHKNERSVHAAFH